jgi:hypothetical protein
MSDRFFRLLVCSQSVYTFVTGLWPLVDIDSFIFVTGPKTDIWLVKTVGALLLPVAVTLFSFTFSRRNLLPSFLLGAGIAAAFAAIDFYYALTDVISKVYLVDGVLEFVFLAGWLMIALRNNFMKHPQRNAAH